MLDHLIEGLSKEEEDKYKKYKDDPLGFCNEYFPGEIYTEDMIKVMESVRDNRITVVKSANATGKTHLAARLVTWFSKTRDDAGVYTSSAPPEKNLANMMWKEINQVFESYPELFKGVNKKYLSLEFENGNRVMGVAIPKMDVEKRFSGRHDKNMLFVIDEADGVPYEAYKGIESCMSGGFTLSLLLLFNPRSKQGPHRKMEDKGNVIEVSALDHPNVKTGKNIIPGAVTQDVTVKRINEWTMPLAPDEEPDESCFKIPPFLFGRQARSDSGMVYPPLKSGYRKITDDQFYYMVLGKYPTQVTNYLINEDWVHEARARWDQYVANVGETPPEGVPCTIGFDVAEFGQDKNVICRKYGGFVPRFITWGGVAPEQSAYRAVQEYVKSKATVAKVDVTGIGSGTPALMREEAAKINHSIRIIPVKVATKPTDVPANIDKGRFRILRDQLWWGLREWLRLDKGAMIPPDHELIEELITPTYSKVNGVIRVMTGDEMKKKLGRSPDKASSLILTFAKGNIGWQRGMNG